MSPQPAPRQLPPFSATVRQHGPTVLRMCRALLPEHDAQDAWSETFVAALRAYPELGPGANLEAWLVTIAKRKAIDVHRARVRRPVPAEQVVELADRSATPVEPDDHPLADRLRTAVAGLTERQRDALLYHHVAGLPYAEVAATIGGSTDAVRRSAADALKLVRTELGIDPTRSRPKE